MGQILLGYRGNRNSFLGHIHEFGTDDGHIPARPVLTLSAISSLAKQHTNSKEGKQLSKDLDLAKYFRKLARNIVTEGKSRIVHSSGLRGNADATIRKKGFNKPLYETGELLSTMDSAYKE